MDEVVETLNNNGLTRLTDFIKEKQLTIAHLLKQEVRSRVISTLRLSMKERFILMDSIKDAGPKTNSWGYPTNFAERHRIAEEYQVFHLLEEVCHYFFFSQEPPQTLWVYRQLTY